MPEPIVTPTPAAAPAPAIDGAKPAGDAKPATPAEKMYTVKVNGKDEQWSESKVLERASKAEGAEAAMKRAAELDKAFNNFVSNAQDPEKLLGLLKDPALKYDDEKQEILVTKLLSSKSPRIVNAVKKWLYDNEIAPAMMDPKEREIAELKAYKKQQEEERAASDKRNQEITRQIAVKKKWDEYRVAIGAGLKAEGLPEAESIVARVARYALLQTRAKQEVNLVDCVKRVKADLASETENRYKGLTEDNVLDHVPAGLAELINKAYLKRLKGGDITGAVPEPVKKASTGSLRDALRDIERGKTVYQE